MCWKAGRLCCVEFPVLCFALAPWGKTHTLCIYSCLHRSHDSGLLHSSAPWIRGQSCDLGDIMCLRERLTDKLLINVQLACPQQSYTSYPTSHMLTSHIEMSSSILILHWFFTKHQKFWNDLDVKMCECLQFEMGRCYLAESSPLLKERRCAGLRYSDCIPVKRGRKQMKNHLSSCQR